MVSVQSLNSEISLSLPHCSLDVCLSFPHTQVMSNVKEFFRNFTYLIVKIDASERGYSAPAKCFGNVSP